MVLLITWVLWEARDWPFRARLFPWAIGIPVLALALIQLGLAVRSALRPERQRAVGGEAALPSDRAVEEDRVTPRGADAATVAAALTAAMEQPEVAVDPGVARRRALAISGWVFAFFFGIWFLGFKLGSSLLTIGFLRFGANESWKISLIFGVATYLFFLLIFDLALNIPFAPGLIAESLGLQSFDSYVVDPILGPITRAIFGR
jgi:hypothetical protein